MEDVEATLGLENKGLDVVDVTREHNGKDLAAFHNISTNVSYAQLQQDILNGSFEGEAFKARFILYIVGVFLCPTSDTGPSLESFKLLCSEGLKGQLNWCMFAYDRLLDGISKFLSREKQTYLTGCLPVLEVKFPLVTNSLYEYKMYEAYVIPCLLTCTL